MLLQRRHSFTNRKNVAKEQKEQPKKSYEDILFDMTRTSTCIHKQLEPFDSSLKGVVQGMTRIILCALQRPQTSAVTSCQESIQMQLWSSQSSFRPKMHSGNNPPLVPSSSSKANRKSKSGSLRSVEVLHFLWNFFHHAEIGESAVLFVLWYLNLLIDSRNFMVTRANWKVLVVGLTVICQKMLSENCMHLAEFSRFAEDPLLSVRSLVQIEAILFHILLSSLQVNQTTYFQAVLLLKEVSG